MEHNRRSYVFSKGLSIRFIIELGAGKLWASDNLVAVRFGSAIFYVGVKTKSLQQLQFEAELRIATVILGQ